MLRKRSSALFVCLYNRHPYAGFLYVIFWLKFCGRLRRYRVRIL